MALTLFDLDDTLISTDSDHAWGEYLVDKQLVDAENYREQNQRFFDEYKRGELDANAYFQFSCAVLTKHAPGLLLEHRDNFVNERIRPHVLPKALQLIAKHKQQGDTLVVITATIDFITQAIVELLGIDTLIAPVAELVDGRYTGGIRGVASIGEGKVTRLKQWLKNKDISLAGSHFYSDSINDLPLLETVDHPIVVDPDPKLTALARTKKWPIISLR